MIDANIIVVGGGCAGMQLINALLKLSAEQTGEILLIESNQPTIHKSWCFWTNKQSEYDFLIEKHWSELKFCSSRSELSEIIKPYQYNYINSERFFEYHKQLISDSSRVRVVSEEVIKFKSEKDLKQVYTLNNQYTARHVYNSTIDHSFVDSTKILLWQHFKGWFIKTDQEVFNSDQATIMDFNISQDQAAHFIYVLPFSKTEALVEFTSFSVLDCYSDQVYDLYLENYISAKFDCQYEIIREEKGKIPMTDYNFPARDKEGIIQIGSAGGAIKPSTGYAFNRISRQTNYLIECFLKNNESIKNVNSSGRFHFYDTLLLQIIRDKPETVSKIMDQLFVNNSFLKILSFLDENSTLFEELSLFSTLPKRLFLKQVLHYVHAKL
jgi:lycopene beta-cyclase